MLTATESVTAVFSCSDCVLLVNVARRWPLTLTSETLLSCARNPSKCLRTCRIGA